MQENLFSFAQKLFPIHRSLTGAGVRKTLKLIAEKVPQLQIHEVPTGTKAFNWTVPQEWSIDEAYIITPDGQKICDIQENNIHILGYSEPVDKVISLEELKKHLYTNESKPDIIPYFASYYKKRWGFCISYSQLQTLQEGNYHVVITSKLFDGHLTYGDIVLPGESKKEILLSTYICHPSLANNEISGPVVATALSKWLAEKQRKYTYRIVFAPETIGSAVYISRHLEALKKNVIAGFNLSCVGDDRMYSFLPSRKGNTLADMVAKHVLKHIYPEYKSYTWSQRGSDERNYCSPGVDLPYCSIMRSKYGTYPEYHTSADALGTVVTQEGLEGAYIALQKVIQCLEDNINVHATWCCEPQLGKYGLYGTITNQTGRGSFYSNILSHADGISILEIAELINKPFWEVLEDVNTLFEYNLLKKV